MHILLVFVGGCVGAVARFATDRVVSARHDSVFPWGTYTVNMVGSAVLGVLAGSLGAGSSWAVVLVGTGFCGALTTFSTLQLELLAMLDADRVGMAILYAGGSVIAGLAGVALGVRAAPVPASAPTPESA
jgi:CrcB protein